MIDTKSIKAISFLRLGYRDYIAARVLLNSGLIIQGTTLASTAIEKYIKVILALNGQSKRVHLNKMTELKKLLDDCYFDITTMMDKVFLDVIDKVYQARYYDDIKAPLTFGFFVNQFIGELDCIVDYFENTVLTGIRDEHGTQIPTDYHKAVESKDPQLYLNNYLLNGISKKEHMEKEDIAFAIQINPVDVGQDELHASSIKMKIPYDGQIQGIVLHFTKEKTTGPNIN